MIRYALRCADGHRFDSWFASGEEYDRLLAAGHLACAVCGGTGVEKVLMAPSIGLGSPPSSPPEAPQAAGPLSGPASAAEQALAELRRRIEARTENVGRDFPAEARRIHAGEAPARPILGEARPAEAQALIEEGIPIAPLPWSNTRKTN